MVGLSFISDAGQSEITKHFIIGMALQWVNTLVNESSIKTIKMELYIHKSTIRKNANKYIQKSFISFDVQYFSTTYTKGIRLSIKAAMMATLPPSTKLGLVSRKEKGKRISEVVSRKKEEILTLTSCMDLGQVTKPFAVYFKTDLQNEITCPYVHKILLNQNTVIMVIYARKSR